MTWQDRVRAKDRFAFFSKNLTAKQEFIAVFTEKRHDILFYICPAKNRCYAPPKSIIINYEDLTKRETWLRINALVSDDTLIILENPSRYAKISSEKVRYLRRLLQPLRFKAIIDIVPFTEDIQYLYTPYAYLDRSILGYAHYYAFRENYSELQEDGSILTAHDPLNLARKTLDWTYIDYSAFLLPNRNIVSCPVTQEEHEAYQTKRTELFSREKNPLRIVTRLADLVHSFESRTARLLTLLSELHGKIAVFTNLTSYKTRAQQAAAGIAHAHFGSYANHHIRLDDCEHMIYLESPIVKPYLLMDIEAALPDNCQVWHFLGDTKVDHYLHSKLIRELTQINDLTIAMSGAQNGRR